MNHYEKLFEPYQREGFPLESVISWLSDTTKADKDIIDQVVSETMGMITQGHDFFGQCECPCHFDKDEYPDANISHYMLGRVYILKESVKKAGLLVLQSAENVKLEARMKQLVNSDKQMLEALHGTWSQRNIPTFRRWLGFKD